MKAPEFPQDLRWFNTKPLQMKALRGKSVLIDFWTYSCVNCIRTLPHVKTWHEKYAPLGLVIIGVHTPEFEFEKEVQNVEQALKNFQITYPVVMDSDYQIWSAYSNHYWPSKFLADKDGKIVYEHAGEGNYSETEEAIQRTLLEVDPKIKLPVITSDKGEGGVCYPTTPETYLGSLRGRPGSVWSVSSGWKIYPEFVEHEEKKQEYQDNLSLRFEASEVNLVMGMPHGGSTKVKIEFSGEPLGEVEVGTHKMYNLIHGSKFLSGELKVFARDAGLRMYAFTFGGCR